jgi:hypothetical protein
VPLTARRGAAFHRANLSRENFTEPQYTEFLVDFVDLGLP